MPLVLPVAQATAASRLTPVLELDHTFINLDNLAGQDAGGVTVISPGFDYSLESRYTTLNMSLLVDTETYTGLDRDDRVSTNLDFDAIFNHDPGRWKSTLSTDIRQVNDGVQSLSQNTFNSFTRELRTFSADTNYKDRLSSTIDYQALLRVDRTNYEDEDATNGANLDLSINNFLSGNASTWTAAVATDVTNTDGDRTQIDLLALTLYYRVNSRWQAFTDLTAWKTSEDGSGLGNDQGRESFLLGLAWANRRDDAIRFGLGEFKRTNHSAKVAIYRQLQGWCHIGQSR